MPIPVSCTAKRNTNWPSDLAMATTINLTLPSGVNLNALLDRLFSICRTRMSSTSTADTAVPMNSTPNSMPSSTAKMRQIATGRAISLRISVGRGANCIEPDSISDRSKFSFNKARNASPDSCMSSTRSSRDSPRPSSCKTSASPSTPFN